MLICDYAPRMCVCARARLHLPDFAFFFPPILASFQGTGSTWMAAKNDRAVRREQEELPTSGSSALTHTRSQSHIQFQPVTHHTTQWQTPRALAHTRSHSHTHFSTVSHTQPQRFGCRLTHSLSAMTKGERGAHVSAGKLIKPTEPLFPKSPQQVRRVRLVFGPVLKPNVWTPAVNRLAASCWMRLDEKRWIWFWSLYSFISLGFNQPHFPL